MKLLYFTAKWCGPCKAFGPIVDRVLAAYPELELQKVDVDENPELAAEYMIRSVPTLVSERKHHRVSGAMNEMTLVGWIKDHCLKGE
jgi:thioredoxin-like negative regulator of GroEL